MASRIRIVCPDLAFAETVGGRLRGPGLSVAVESDPERLTASRLDAERVDLVVVAVRRHEERVLRWLSSLRRALPALEVVLLNLGGEIRVSMEAMRAGATGELAAPFDLATLRRTVSAALRRRRKRPGRRRASLADRLERAMAAAAFAEAGEAETAREILGDREGT